MSEELQKYRKYLRNEDAPLTRYAKLQLVKKLDKENEVKLINESSFHVRETTSQGTDKNDVKQDEYVIDIDFDESTDTSSTGTRFHFLQEQLLSCSGGSNNSDNEIEYSDNELYSSDDEELLTYLEEKNKKKNSSGNIRSLIKDEKFFECISLCVNRSPAELLLMILKYCVRNKLSFTAITQLLKLVNVLSGKLVLPDSRYGMDKLCSTPENVSLHAVCTTCTNYIGIFQKLTSVLNCGQCNSELDVKNPSSTCFFAILDPSDAIRDIIESNEDYYDNLVRHREHKKDHIKDIYDGALYRSFVRKLNDGNKYSYITCVFNSDGAAVFKSSTYSIWPIYIILNEIPLQQRFTTAITCALWFGRNKPEMTIFLDKFVECFNNLSVIGIPSTIKGKSIVLKVYPLVSSVDSVARAPMNGTTQFNGHYGCDWCLHKGEYFAGSMRYPYESELPKNRDHATTLEHAIKAVETNKRVFGVITISPLVQLQHFDVIQGFTPDYMHCFAAGVVKQFTEYILNELRKADIEYMDNIFANIKAPYQIGRLTRVLKDREYWKAREYENWVLYYSLPLFSTVTTNNAKIQHWSLLVEALHICLQADITFAELNRANEILHKFVKESDMLYSLAACTYNVHQLLHLPASIYNWGPLFSHSTYPFESANKNLLTSIHCAKGVILQIVRYENLQRCIQILENSINFTCCQLVSQYCENLTSNITKKTLKVTSITYFGKQSNITSDLTEQFRISPNAKVFYKIVYQGTLYMTCKKENKRSCNYYAKLKNNIFCKINLFIVDMNQEKEYTICQVINTKPYKYTTFIRQVTYFSNIICTETKNLSATCVFIETDNKQFIIPAPNQLHY